MSLRYQDSQSKTEEILIHKIKAKLKKKKTFPEGQVSLIQYFIFF